MRPTKSETTVIPAASRERVVATLELSRDLFVRCSSTRDKHHVEARQTKYWNRENRYESHQTHRDNGLRLAEFIFTL